MWLFLLKMIVEEPKVHGVPVSDLTREEIIKVEKNPLDIWDRMEANARAQKSPEGGDIFRYKYHGLFYDAKQNHYMLRCRIPGGVLSADQFDALADMAERFGGGGASLTTRANIQIREIPVRHAVDCVTLLDEVGLTSKGSGADNVRNITASPTSGIDPYEMIDVRPLVRSLHHRILNDRTLYDLPRKFNIAFDSGGSVSVLGDTNDIGFYPIKVDKALKTESGEMHPGFYFRVLVGGLTSRRTFAQDLGLWISPMHAVEAAVTMLRVFQESGCRTNRKRARLKDLLDEWGLKKFSEVVRSRMSVPVMYEPFEWIHPGTQLGGRAHIGIHPQKQTGLYYGGIAIPVGKLTSVKMKLLAKLARECGSGEIRLTVWQNLLIPNIPFAKLAAFRRTVLSMGFSLDPNSLSGGVIACTGNQGCHLSASDTKSDGLALIKHIDGSLKLKQPVNIHLSGCTHSCAQHYIGDIGLIATKIGEAAIPGYHLFIGGGAESHQKIGREIFRNVTGADLPGLLAKMLAHYQKVTGETEDFSSFANRLSVDELRDIASGTGASFQISSKSRT